MVNSNKLEKYGITINKQHNVSINYNRFVTSFLKTNILLYTKIGWFYLYKDGIYQRMDENDLMRLIKTIIDELIPEKWKNGYGQRIINLLHIVVPKIDNMNADMKHICLMNGILDINKNKLLPHSSKYYLSTMLPIEYDSEARCPRFRKFLKQIFDCDKERIMLIQEWFGYCLTNSVSAQKCLFLLGAGANGKSVLLEILIRLVGEDNLSTLPLVDFESSFRRVALVDRKINVVTEGGFKVNRLNTNQLKAVIAGDNIMAEIKGGNTFNFKPYCKVIAALNNMPRVSDTSHGFRRRICLVTFDKVFKPDEQNKNLVEELTEELSGILNFSLKGLERLKKNDFNFTEPSKCKEALNQYFEYNNPLNVFVKSKLSATDIKFKIKNSELHKSYLKWCKERHINVDACDRLQFIHDIKEELKMQDINFEVGISNGQRHIKGIRFKNISES